MKTAGEAIARQGMEAFFEMNTMSDIILYAEDDDDDAFLLRRAFEQAGVTNRLVIVEDGKAAIEYISGNGVYADRSKYPLPCLTAKSLG